MSGRQLVSRGAVGTERLRLEVFSTACGVHPDLVHRFVSLGLIEPVERRDAEVWFTQNQVRTLQRMLRLRSDFSLNYAALGLVVDLLDRIESLERTNRFGS